MRRYIASTRYLLFYFIYIQRRNDHDVDSIGERERENSLLHSLLCGNISQPRSRRAYIARADAGRFSSPPRHLPLLPFALISNGENATRRTRAREGIFLLSLISFLVLFFFLFSLGRGRERETGDGGRPFDRYIYMYVPHSPFFCCSRDDRRDARISIYYTFLAFN